MADTPTAKRASSPRADPLPPYAAHALDATYMQLYQAGLRASQMAEQAWRPGRFYQLLQMLKLTRGLAGATAEAGCYRGLASYLMCHSRRLEDAAFRGASHFIVDSLQGMSAPVAEDGAFSARRHAEKAFTQTSVEHVRRTLQEFPDVHIHAGWIPEVLATLPQQTYRFVHVDVDIYVPTLACFRYFFPRLVAGGMLVCDDYGPWPEGNWPGCAKAVHAFCEEAGIPFAALETGNVVVINRG